MDIILCLVVCRFETSVSRAERSPAAEEGDEQRSEQNNEARVKLKTVEDIAKKRNSINSVFCRSLLGRYGHGI